MTSRRPSIRQNRSSSQNTIKQNFRLKKTKSVATGKWPGTDIKWLEQQEEFLEEVITIELLKQLTSAYPLGDIHDKATRTSNREVHGTKCFFKGRLSNTSYMGFQYSVENVVDHLTTTGITAIPGERRSIEELEGMSWHLKPPEQTSVRVPSRVAVNERLNRSADPTNQNDQSKGQVRNGQHLGNHPENGIIMSDDEVTPGKVTILEERSDWDDDEQSSGQILWTLPPAWTESGVMLVLPSDPGLWSEVISRWESITLNRLNNQTWSDNKAKLAFVENLLGESKLCNQIGEECIPSQRKKLFAKLPPSLSKKIEESFRAKHPGLSSGVLPAIKFTHTFVSEMCKDAALAKELRDLSLFSIKGKADSWKDIFAKDCAEVTRKHCKDHCLSKLILNDNWDMSSGSMTAVFKAYQKVEACALCARNYLDKTVNVKRKQPQKQEEEKDFNSTKEYYEEKAAMQKKEEIWQLKESSLVRDISDALKIIDQLRIEKEELGELIIEKKRLEEQKDEEIRKLKAQLQKKEEEAEVQFPKEEFPPLGKHSWGGVQDHFVETEVHYFEFDIPNCKAFGTTAIIDTGASACCINKRVIPEEALEPLNQTVVFIRLKFKVNRTRHKIKQAIS
ncbi:hypothetical protein Tco_0796494 [Tanacetum coccineum]